MEAEEEEEEGRGGGGGDDEGRKLAEIVKETHRLLRTRYKEAGGGAGAGTGVWREHLGREEHLRRYASAMHALATQHWPSERQASVSRVNWVRAAVRDYYWGGGLRAATEKEMRKLHHLGLAPDQPHSPSPPPADGKVRVLDVGSCYNPFQAFPEFEVTAIDLCPAHESVFKGDFLNLEIVEKGDESPGEGRGREEEEEERKQDRGDREEGIKEGRERVDEENEKGTAEQDKGEISEKRRTEENSKQAQGTEQESREVEGCGEQEKLEEKQRKRGREEEKGRRQETQKQGTTERKEEEKEEGRGEITEGEIEETGGDIGVTHSTISTLVASAFDVVVLSLVLEYLPAPTQRWECCRRAWHLLAPGGLLAIVTPDSRHQGANAHLYQLWRVTLAGLGFGRVKYDKRPHFHGLVFRKGLCRVAWQGDAARFLKGAMSAAASVRAKLRGIDYSKVDREMYIPQDFENEGVKDARRRKRRMRECEGEEGRKRGRKEREEEGGERDGNKSKEEGSGRSKGEEAVTNGRKGRKGEEQQDSNAGEKKSGDEMLEEEKMEMEEKMER